MGLLIRSAIREYLERTHGIQNANIIAQWRPQKSASIVTIGSAKSDTVTKSMWKLLKGDAKRQFSGTLPALLCVHLADLTEAQLQDLADIEEGGTPTALQRIASLVLDARPHLHSIAFMTSGDVRQATPLKGRQSIRESGKSYVFKNPNHPLAENQRLSRLFR